MDKGSTKYDVLNLFSKITKKNSGFSFVIKKPKQTLLRFQFLTSAKIKRGVHIIINEFEKADTLMSLGSLGNWNIKRQ